MRLRPIEELDLPLFVRWLNDPDVRYWLSMAGGPELPLESEREWYEGMRGDPACGIWGIGRGGGQPDGALGGAGPRSGSASHPRTAAAGASSAGRRVRLLMIP